jgi:hypothetical protein
MVRKIRVIDDHQKPPMTENEFRLKMLETLSAIDWKLWELLKRSGFEEKTLSATGTPSTQDFKSIIIDEDII